MRILCGTGNVLLILLQWLLKAVSVLFRLVLEAAKIFLLIFSLILRIFMVFVNTGTA